MCVLGLVDIIEYCSHVCVGIGMTLLSIVVMCV